MTDTNLQLIRTLLRKVLAGEVSAVALQSAVDHMIIDEAIPDGISEEALVELYEIQTTLELIAEHQATHMGTTSFYSPEKIISLLSKFSDFACKQNL